MRPAVDHVLSAAGGVASRARIVRAVGVAQFDDEVERGRLVRVFRRAYCRPWDADQVVVHEGAAIASLGAPVALSHLSSLRRWALLDDPGTVHVSIPDTRMSRPQPGLAVHRVARAPRAVRHDGLPVTSPANAVVTSWPLLSPDERRAPAIAAVRQRLVTPADLTGELRRCPRLPGRRELQALIGLLAAGCESELEIWGLDHVFDVPGLDHGVRQRLVEVGSRRFRLDLAYDAERVAVELDGDRFHSSVESRDRDRRRDAALATLGWLTLRFSWLRLHTDVQGCRRDTLATLAARRR